MQKSKRSNGKRLGTSLERIARLEDRVEWVIQDAFQTLANSVAEQASACQAVLKVLADLYPDRRMVKCVSNDGRVFYEFKTLEQIEADAAEMQKAREYVEQTVMEVDQNAEVQPAKH